jgi:hypothetical protein
MPCFRPLTAWRSKRAGQVDPITGKLSRPITFNLKQGFKDQELTLPCGKCHGCRLEYARQWAVRCMHEASLHEENSFLTLTYNDENLPTVAPGISTVVKRDVQLFIKRLRKATGKKISYYAGAEYGDKKGRAHYHICIFGYDFSDKYLWSVKRGNKLFRSPKLEKLWPYGHSRIGDLTFQSASYVARYCMKKMRGQDSWEHYSSHVDLETGEIISREPEFALMSRRPAIGKKWYEKYKDEVLDNGNIIANGHIQATPKFYEKLAEKEGDTRLNVAKRKRREHAASRWQDNIGQRLVSKEICLKQKTQTLTKELE